MGRSDRTDERRRAALRRLQTEGIEAATTAAIEVCKDPRAPPPARATAAGLIFRATSFGGFGKDREDDDNVPVHEMSPEQFARAVERARRSLAGEVDPSEDGEEAEDSADRASDVFG